MSWLREADAEPIPGYRLVEPLGSGGFGEVWKCIAPGGIDKAIKFVFGNLNDDDGDGIRAEQEQKALKKVKDVRHPFVLSMDRIEVIGGELAIVMELADKSLHDLLQEFIERGAPGIPRADVIRYLHDAADGLDHLIEKHSLQHLDVKPRNLFLIADRVKVADFGLVKHLERQSSVGLSGGLSPVYAAPETITGKVSKHSDQYSLAIVYCELLANRRPFAGKNIRQLAMQHMNEPPDLTMIPEEDRAIVGTALAKDPAKRYPSCLAFIRALAPHVAHAVAPMIVDFGAIEREQSVDSPSENGSATVLYERASIEAVAARTPTLQQEAVPRYRHDPDPSGIMPREADLWGDDAPDSSNSNGDGSHSGAQFQPPVSEFVDNDAAVDLGAPTTGPRPDVTGTIVSRGVLRPTMFIGLGTFGRRALAEVRCRLLDRFGDPSEIPAYRFLFIDGDSAALDLATQGTPEIALRNSETFLMPLQPVINYRRRMIEQLSMWLPREKLHGIPRSLQPQGSRALGRLAYIDNFPRLQSRLRREFQIATRSDSLDASVEQTGLSQGKGSPRVFVFASGCGGSGGALVDLGYSLRRLLRQLNFADAPLTLYNFCGAPSDPESPRLEQANAYATLVELNHYRQPETTYEAHFGSEGLRVTDSGSPYDSIYLVASPERSPTGFRDVIAHLATYVTEDVSSPLGPTLTKSRRTIPGKKPGFRSFGTNTVWFPRGLLLRVAARQAVARLLDVWQAIAMPKNMDSIEKLVSAALADPGLQWKSLSTELNRLAQSEQLDSPILATEVFLEKLGLDAASPAATENPGAWALQALEGVRRWAGPGTGRELEALWKKSQFYRQLTQASQQLGEHWEAYLFAQIGDLLRLPGNRIAATEAGLRRLNQFCTQAIRKQWDVIEEHYQSMKRLREDLEAAVHVCQGGVKKLFGGSGRALRHFVGLASQFARRRIAQDLLEAGVQFYMTLQGRLEDRLRDLGFVRQRINGLKLALAVPLDAQSAEPRTSDWGTTPGFEIADPFWDAVQGTATVQVVLPAGVNDLEQSAGQFVQSLQPEHWLALDEWLQSEVLAPMGDLVHASTGATDIANYLGRPLVEMVADYLGTILPITDVAQVEFSMAEAQGLDLREQLRAYMNSARSLVPGHGREDTYLLVPETEAGQAFGRAAQDTFPSVRIVPVPNPIEVTVLREQGDIGDDALNDFLTEARKVYQEVVGVPALSPHARFDVYDWRPLGFKNR